MGKRSATGLLKWPANAVARRHRRRTACIKPAKNTVKKAGQSLKLVARAASPAKAGSEPDQTTMLTLRLRSEGEAGERPVIQATDGRTSVTGSTVWVVKQLLEG